MAFDTGLILRPAILVRLLSFAAALGMPLSAVALEATLTAPGAPDRLVNRLTAGSLSMNAEDRGIETTQELISATLADYGTLVSILYDDGYFGPQVSIRVDGREASSIPPLDAPAQINRIDIFVTTGPKFTFGRAEIAPLAPGAEVPEGFASGAPASTGAIRDAAVRGVRGWEEAGHPKADIGEQDISADHRSSELNARISLTPGPKLRFGDFAVAGNQSVRTDAIRRIAGFPTGEFYSPELLQKSTTRLRRTGAFSSISVKEGETPNAEGTLDFEVTAVESLPRRIAFGAEISSSEGLDVNFEWTHRNLFGAAERLRFEAAVRNLGGDEDVDGILSLRLDRPAAFGPDYDQFYLLELELLDEPNYTLLRGLAGVGIRRIFSDNLFAETAIAVNSGLADDAFGTDREFHYVAFPSRVEWDMRNDKISATQGFYLDTRLMPFAGFDNSDAGARLFVDGRSYFGFGENDRVVLAGRLQLGSILGASLSGTQPDLLFYSGGAGTVRGQPYQSLGISTPGGTAGGRAFLGLSAEVRTKITQAISIVGFFDYGALDADAFVDGDSPSHSGAGLGVRYDIAGIGALRFDLAYPVDGTTGDGLQFYLGIGQAF